MKILIAIMLSILISGCASGELARNVEPGMSPEQVKQIMGNPDGFQQAGTFAVYKYTNRLISGWSWDRTDYSFIFQNGKLVEYGAGEIRERNVGGAQVIYLYRR